MYIGQAAKLAGTTPKAIRHYEAIGLMAPPKRLGTYRYYSDQDIQVIRLIKCAQTYGFKLSEIESIINKRSHNRFPQTEFIEAIRNKRQQIKSEIHRLAELDKGLATLSDQIKNQKCSCQALSKNA